MTDDKPQIVVCGLLSIVGHRSSNKLQSTNPLVQFPAGFGAVRAPIGIVITTPYLPTPIPRAESALVYVLMAEMPVRMHMHRTIAVAVAVGMD
jgi:hypothetical protein